MKRVKLGINFTVSLIFFGIATLEAFESGNWIRIAFWLAIGIAFLIADNLRKSGDGSRPSSKKPSLPLAPKLELDIEVKPKGKATIRQPRSLA